MNQGKPVPNAEIGLIPRTRWGGGNRQLCVFEVMVAAPNQGRCPMPGVQRPDIHQRRRAPQRRPQGMGCLAPIDSAYPDQRRRAVARSNIAKSLFCVRRRFVTDDQK
jgi:hypothetical protein